MSNMMERLAIKKSSRWSSKKSRDTSKFLVPPIPSIDEWAGALPDRIFEQIFSNLSGKDLLSCRLVCVNWEEIITPMITSKCCLAYKGRPKDLIPWLVSKATNVQRPITRFLKVCQQNPSLVTGWNELRIEGITPKSSKILTTTILSPADPKSTINFTNITILYVANSSYRFQRLHSIFSLLPKLQTFTDSQTNYLLDWSICCKTFPEIQEEVIRPFQGMRCPVKNLKLRRDESGFKTLFLMKILGFTCDSLESFELKVDTYDFQYPMAFIDRMDYATVVGLMLNMNSDTLKELRFEWVGQLTNHYYDELLRCIGVMSWNASPWNLTKVDFHFDWIFLGNPDFHTIVVPFIQRLEKLEELKIRHIILQPEWAEVLDRIRPINYCESKLNIEFRVMLSDNANLSAGQTPVSVIGQMPFLKGAIKGIRVAITSELTDELRKILPMGGEGEEFPGTTELWVQKTEWKPHMRFMTYNIEKLCETFKNLTVLIIADGDKLQFMRDLRSKRQWERMTNAHIWDEDMQLIFRHLRFLTVLKLRCRMVYLTDGGTVGLTQGAIADMREKNYFFDIPDPATSVTGYSFSDLTDLTEVCLHGLNKGISDITLYNGFKGLGNLKSLEMLGVTSFSVPAKKWIKAAFPSCAVMLISGYKECLPDGTWFRHPDSSLVWSNYTTCINLEEYQVKVIINWMYEVGYCISTFALAMSLFIFCTYKCLECTRVKIHRNLFASFIIDNLLWVAWYRFIVADENVIIKNPPWCKWLYILVQYFLLANYFWMFCEGFYLHYLLVFTFLRSESQLLKVFYVFGWLGPIVPISFYVYLRWDDGYRYDQACWIDPRHQLFITVPVCISLGFNLIFLINILRVLVTKLHDQRGFRNHDGQAKTIGSSPENQYSLRKAARATLILIPLLGIHYLLLPFRPNPGTTREIVYDVVSAVSASLQGLCVAILFCFCNSEVIAVLKRRVCHKFCLRDHPSSPNHINRGDSAMPTSHGHTLPVLDGERGDLMRGRVQSNASSVETCEAAMM